MRKKMRFTLAATISYVKRSNTRNGFNRAHFSLSVKSFADSADLSSGSANLNMGTEQTKDSVKDLDWKSIGKSSEQGSEEVVKKRLPKKIRQIPDSYFLPRRSLPSAIAFYGVWIVAGLGAGMIAEIWINKKIKEDGGVIWEFDK